MSLAIAGLDGEDNLKGDCLVKKGLDKGKGEGGFIDGFIFHAVLICCFLFLIFKLGPLISYQD